MAAFNKLLGKSSSLQAILDKQKSLQECMVKSNPCRINVSSALLKWSMTESNISLFDALSSWSDLDHALIQLTQAVIDQNFSFRQTFKNIQGEELRLAKLQKDTEAASKKVKQICMKLDSARKSKKVDKVKIDNLEAELTLAKGKEREMLSILDTKDKEFEVSKGKWLKEILCLVSQCYVECLEKSLKVWKVKHQIAKNMADEPVYHGDKLKTESHLKVSSMFTELGMELPSREDTTNMKHRTLPSKPPAPDTSRQTTGKTRVTKSMIAQGCYEWQVDEDPEGSESSDDSETPGTLTCGIKVLPSGGTMKATHPKLTSSLSDGMSPRSPKTKRSTPPLSPTVVPSRVELTEKRRDPSQNDNSDRRPLPKELKKPALLPKPSKNGSNIRQASSTWSSKESVDGINEAEHEYSDVPIEVEPGEEFRYPKPRENGERTARNNNNIQQIVEEEDSDSEDDYENVAVGQIS
ncbi:putative histone-lysine N-methyltransferase SETD1B [Apostichopus japonicus]|nr:putative histone-lysine N-methyltransferase SETD1B [Apostichopus japonicus]